VFQAPQVLGVLGEVSFTVLFTAIQLELVEVWTCKRDRALVVGAPVLDARIERARLYAWQGQGAKPFSFAVARRREGHLVHPVVGKATGRASMHLVTRVDQQERGVSDQTVVLVVEWIQSVTADLPADRLRSFDRYDMVAAV
jgi:hypothetical protein